MRTTKEALAIVGTCAALGGTVGVIEESHGRAKADANVVVGEACRDTYADNTAAIGKDVLDCMRNGWVPHGGRADDGSSENPGEMRAEDPDGLLDGYIAGQKARASRVELFKIGWTTISGAAVGFLITGGFGVGGARRREDSPPREDNDGPEAAAPPEPPTPPSPDR